MDSVKKNSSPDSTVGTVVQFAIWFNMALKWLPFNKKLKNFISEKIKPKLILNIQGNDIVIKKNNHTDSPLNTPGQRAVASE